MTQRPESVSESGSEFVSEFVSVSVTDGIAVVRMDRPKLNAVNTAIVEGLSAAAAQVDSDSQVHVVVLTGGEKAFAAGADIAEMAELSYAGMVAKGGWLSDAVSAIAAIRKPTIAAIERFALGGGCEIALGCDFRVCGSDAKLGQPEVLLGVIPGAGGTQRLARLIGPAKAKDLIFSGRFVEAQEALAIGLVDQVCEPGAALQTAIAAMKPYVGGAPLALAAAKEAIDKGLEVDLRTGLALEGHLFAGLFATEDQSTGMRSFLEHGPGKATFSGR
ncbi:enoyl-CoA hydratase/isomerase family protein [Dermacoccaceae bacterium W4C1]